MTIFCLHNDLQGLTLEEETDHAPLVKLESIGCSGCNLKGKVQLLYNCRFAMWSNYRRLECCITNLQINKTV